MRQLLVESLLLGAAPRGGGVDRGERTVFGAQSMSARLRDSRWTYLLFSGLLGIFAAIALVLSAGLLAVPAVLRRPVTLAAVAAVLAAATVGACVGPARRAVGIDPVEALRFD